MTPQRYAKRFGVRNKPQAQFRFRRSEQTPESPIAIHWLTAPRKAELRSSLRTPRRCAQRLEVMGETMPSCLMSGELEV